MGLELTPAERAQVASAGFDWLLQRAEEALKHVVAEAAYSKADADALLQDLESRFVTLKDDSQALAEERDRLRDESHQRSACRCLPAAPRRGDRPAPTSTMTHAARTPVGVLGVGVPVPPVNCVVVLGGGHGCTARPLLAAAARPAGQPALSGCRCLAAA
jgi:hypothetical protein